MDSIQIHLRIGRYSWGLQTSYTSQLTYHNVYVIYCFIVRSRIFWQTWAILLLGCFFFNHLKAQEGAGNPVGTDHLAMPLGQKKAIKSPQTDPQG